MTRTTAPLTRRRFGALLGGAALGIAATGAMAAPATIERRVSGLRMLDWREHFETVENDAIWRSPRRCRGAAGPRSS
jgi:hypothetical protein